MSENLIFGVGNEVLILTTVFLVILLSGCIFFRPWDVYDRFADWFRSVFQEQNFDPPRSVTDEQLEGGPCMRTYLQNDEFVVQTMLCPLCRQPLTLLFNSYTDDERRADPGSEIGSQRVEMNVLINRFNRISAATPKTLLQNIYDWPVLIRRLFNELFSERPMLLFRLRIILLLLCGVVYVFSPVDALPEAVYGILGFIDDILVVFFCIWYMVNVYRSILASREEDFE
ncbi:E3 ubiquitin-protein ligase RNF170-like isoform X2 [Hetaerina americana]|uniref:E3 ubiquitin-protein ligase RNF170-like isoform X2 n=1 Tax=Hetaerina americana TaxID=62018 RepID=UPI003A7F2E36